MKKALLFRLAVLVAAMMCAFGAAAAEAYANYTPSTTTLTFYYDNYRSSRSGTTYDLNTLNNSPGWYTDGTTLTPRLPMPARRPPIFGFTEWRTFSPSQA